MSITVMFPPTNITPAMYDETIELLEAAGAGAPPGREHHTCFVNEGKIGVVDVWSSLAEFEAFGEVLMPILDKVGAEVSDPQILETHNIIK